MLNRVFKTIFILSLCLGITLPSNAGSVDVSDGSAFVTKSELSYQLNNISKRMEQLENSLDSRIDEMVSSYLTRNGIWNGEDVAIDKTETRLTTANFKTSWNAWSVNEVTVWQKTATCKKSGMIVATVHVEGKKGTAHQDIYRCYLRITGGQWPGFEDDARVFLTLTEIVNGTNNIRSRIEIANSQQRYSGNNTDDTTTGRQGAYSVNTTSHHILPLPLNNDYVMLGFVSKDSSVKISMEHYVADFQAGDSSNTTWGIQSGAYLSTIIKDCKIY